MKNRVQSLFLLWNTFLPYPVILWANTGNENNGKIKEEAK